MADADGDEVQASARGVAHREQRHRAGPSRPQHARSGWWRAASWFLLLAGVAGSLAGASAWSEHQSRQATTQFRDRASGIAAAIGESVQRELDLQRSFGQLVGTSANPTNAALARWLGSLDIATTYPGTVGLTLVERVPAGDLAAYEQAVTADPIPGYGSGPYAVYPPGTRQDYCLSRFGVIVSATGLPAGIDI